MRSSFALFLCVINHAACTTLSDREKEILDDVLSPEKYDPRVRPPSNDSSDGSTKVSVNTFVRSISSVDDAKMQFSVQLTFRQEWLDERLKYNNHSGTVKFVNLGKTKLVWMPDLFFSNENEGHFHDIMVPNVYLRIYPSGEVHFSRRLSLTLGCPMNLRTYPMDQHVCLIRIASYAHNSEGIDLFWRERDPVTVVRNPYTPNFSLQTFVTSECDSSTSTGTYHCIKVEFLFKRRIFYHLLRVYVPTSMLVIISWTSFWFETASSAPRLMLSFLTLMTLALYASFVGASMPAVPYTKAIDVWTGVCLTFVFGAFVEFVVVHYLTKSASCRQNLEQTDPSINDGEGEGDAFFMKPLGKSEHKRSSIRKLNCLGTWSKRFKTRAKCVDVASRIIFPALFVIFNLAYWIGYSIESQLELAQH